MAMVSRLAVLKALKQRPSAPLNRGFVSTGKHITAGGSSGHGANKLWLLGAGSGAAAVMAAAVAGASAQAQASVVSSSAVDSAVSVSESERSLANLMRALESSSAQSAGEAADEATQAEKEDDQVEVTSAAIEEDEVAAEASDEDATAEETSEDAAGTEDEEATANDEQSCGAGEESSSGACPLASSPAAAAGEPMAQGPGMRVNVDLDPELVESLPLMPLSEVRAADGLKGDKLYATYEGVVYDVTSFAEEHPGGCGLLRTAAGLDLGHFFANYTIHGQSDKAARWLAPLAIGRLTPEDRAEAEASTNAEAHVSKRMALIGKARTKVLAVAISLPFWMLLRSIVRAVGSVVPALARAMARALPVTVPGYSVGAEPLDAAQLIETTGEAPSVAVIGGGIAGCGAAWCLQRSGFQVSLFEARPQVSGNARTFDWNFSDCAQPVKDMVKSCVSVTAWPPMYYKNYMALLDDLKIETVPMPLSWFLNSKVPGAEGSLWAADPTVYPGSLREVFKKDFAVYGAVERFARATGNFFTLQWAPWKSGDTPSMYNSHTGLGLLNPLNVVPLYSLFKMAGGSDLWWDVVFTPHYTASFLVDELRPFPAVFGPLIEAQIPLNPIPGENVWNGSSEKSPNDCHITTCVTWKDAGVGIRAVFSKMMEKIKLSEGLRVREVQVLPNGKKRVYDEHDGFVDVDRVIFACPANAVGNILKEHTSLEEAIYTTPVYADDYHPTTGHMHAVMHSDPTVIAPEFREQCLTRASNYVEVTRMTNGEINIENQYNFGVQTPGPGVYNLPLEQKPVMLISHALGEGKSIDPEKVRGTGNHARAHPLYSGWNVMAQLSLRLVQGRNGVYYCSNWTTPGNCHDMSLLSGFAAAHAVGAAYPFPENKEARKDFDRLRDLMGI